VRALCLASRAVKIALPQVKVDGVPGRGLVAPQLLRLETDGIEMLGMFALEVGVGVGEHMHPVVVPDDAHVIPRVVRLIVSAKVADRSIVWI
jgi:hypothetical protein